MKIGRGFVVCRLHGERMHLTHELESLVRHSRAELAVTQIIESGHASYLPPSSTCVRLGHPVAESWCARPGPSLGTWPASGHRHRRRPAQLPAALGGPGHLSRCRPLICRAGELGSDESQAERAGGTSGRQGLGQTWQRRALSPGQRHYIASYVRRRTGRSRRQQSKPLLRSR